MVLVNYTTRELTAKVVYYGPGLCGKTTNLQYIFDSLPPDKKGKMISLATKTDRTLFFDFLPLDLGTIKGMRTRIQLYTVPGQVFYNETRKLVLRGADGIVFVADSNRNMMDANLESLQNLEDNLREYGIEIKEIPLVLQYNKRDLPNIYSVEELDKSLKQKNPEWTSFEAVAIQGTGVHETLKGISKLVLKHLAAKFSSGSMPQSAEAPAGAPAAQAPPQQAPPQQATPTTESAPEPTPAAPAEPAPAEPVELEAPTETEAPMASSSMGSEQEGTGQPEPVHVEESLSIGGEMSDEEYAQFYGGSGVEPAGGEAGEGSWDDEDALTIDTDEDDFGSDSMEMGGGGEDFSDWMGGGSGIGEEEESEEETFVLETDDEPAAAEAAPAQPAAPSAPATPAGPEIRAAQPIEIPIPLPLAGGQGEITRTVTVPLTFQSSGGSQTVELKLQLVLRPKD